MIKKPIILILSLMLALSALQLTALGANATYLSLDEALADAGSWNALKAEITFKDGGLTHKSADGDAKVFGYNKAKFHNEILRFDTVLEFKSVDKWQGFMIRARNTQNVPWTENNNYLIVITENQIELQRFGYKHAFLAVKPTPFNSGERVSIEYGAINTEEGVQLILRVNGVTVFDVVDTDDAAIKDEGYFSIYNPNSISVLPFTGYDNPTAPSVNMTGIETAGMVGDSVNASYSFSDIDGGTEGATEFCWYRSLIRTDHFGVSQSEPENYRERYLEKIEGATDKTYIITEKDIGCYLRCAIKAKSKETGNSGQEVMTPSVYIDSVTNILNNGMFFATDCTAAIINGKEVKLSSADTGLCVIKNKKLFVPLRLVAEGLGYSVDWNNETQTVVLKNAEKEITLSGERGTVIENGRTLICIDDIYKLFGVKACNEPLYSMGIISDVAANLNPIDYKVILRDIRAKIPNK